MKERWLNIIISTLQERHAGPGFELVGQSVPDVRMVSGLCSGLYISLTAELTVPVFFV